MQLHYEVIGQGQPIIILHGFLGEGENWTYVSKQLAAHYQVYRIDARNHGNSFHSAEHNYTAMAQDVLQLIQNLHLSNITVIGHSMGGKTAMFLAKIAAHCIHKLIVVDIAPRYYPVHHASILQALQNLDLTPLSNRTQALEALAIDLPDIGLRQFLLKNLVRKEDALVWKINLPALSANVGNVGEPCEDFICTIPTLFIKGEKSDYITNQDAEKINNQFTTSTLEIVMNAGHWVHAEQPAAFLEKVKAFLA